MVDKLMRQYVDKHEREQERNRDKKSAFEVKELLFVCSSGGVGEYALFAILHFFLGLTTLLFKRIQFLLDVFDRGRFCKIFEMRFRLDRTSFCFKRVDMPLEALHTKSNRTVELFTFARPKPPDRKEPKKDECPVAEPERQTKEAGAGLYAMRMRHAAVEVLGDFYGECLFLGE